jgi:hypothetical protein
VTRRMQVLQRSCGYLAKLMPPIFRKLPQVKYAYVLAHVPSPIPQRLSIDHLTIKKSLGVS